jgi:transcriptional regulator with XRE-family HTH domain
MAGNAGRGFDTRDRLGRDALLRPPGDGGFVHAGHVGELDQQEAAACENGSEVGAHDVDSCATYNYCQGVALQNQLTPSPAVFGTLSAMSNQTGIHRGRQPRRPHHIADWAEHRSLRQADIAELLGADKSVVSRWFAGTTPGFEWQEKLAALFHCDPESLFRHPNEDWLKRFMERRSIEEIERIKQILEAAFPVRTNTAA